jgi:hypothetical protein
MSLIGRGDIIPLGQLEMLPTHHWNSDHNLQHHLWTYSSVDRNAPRSRTHTSQAPAQCSLPHLIEKMFRFLLTATCIALVSAFGSSVSGFGGKVLISGVTNGVNMEMKKGKANVPPQMRSQYKRQQEMQAQREQMIASSQPGEDNLPVFNLFVRTKRANLVSADDSMIYTPNGEFARKQDYR